MKAGPEQAMAPLDDRTAFWLSAEGLRRRHWPVTLTTAPLERGLSRASAVVHREGHSWEIASAVAGTQREALDQLYARARRPLVSLWTRLIEADEKKRTDSVPSGKTAGHCVCPPDAPARPA